MSDRVARITTRREFVKKGLTLLGWSATVPSFVHRLAWSMEDPRDLPLVSSKPGVPDERILVLVQLAGGNDGLNTVIPFRQDDYYRQRPTIAIRSRNMHRIRGDLALHPSAVGLKELFDEGRAAVIQGVGYPNPNRSHFTSTEIWESGSPGLKESSGWIGRYFDHCCAGSDPVPADRAVALTREVPLAVRGEDFSGIAFTDLKSLHWSGVKDPQLAKAFSALNAEVADKPGQPPQLPFLTRVAMDAQVSAAKMDRALNRKGGRGYPRTAFGDNLKTVAKLITGGLPTRVYYVSLSGFDTHSGQLGRHARLIDDLSKGIRAFVGELEKTGDMERVTVMTFSEFGRRVYENASGGTDHGEAAPMFVFGSRIRPGVHGVHPSLNRLRRGDLAYTTDFRQVYGTVLKDWMGVEPAEVFGRRLKPLKLFRA